jgi:LPS export ABC transporter protein LptC
MINSLRLSILLLIFCACGKDIEKVKMLSEPSTLPIELGKNVSILYTDSGYTKAKVYAPEIARYANEFKNQTEMRKGIKIEFYNRAKQVESMLTANYAVRLDRDKKMTAKNNVVLVNVKGDTLRTEELHWDESAQLIYSDKFVKITTPDEVIMGTGFESNAEFTRYKINQISGTMSLKQ